MSSKNNIKQNSIFLWSMLFCSLLLAVLGIIKDGETMAYLAPTLYLSVGFGAVFSYGMSQSIGVLVRNRMKKGQHKNAKRVIKAALLLHIVLSVILILVSVLLKNDICDNIFKLGKAAFSFEYLGILFLLTGFMGIMQGYLEGVRAAKIVSNSRILFSFLCLLIFVFGRIRKDYGVKVAALLKNDSFIHSYEANGVMLGLCIAVLITDVILLFFVFVMARSSSIDAFLDNSRLKESVFSLIFFILRECLYRGLLFALPAFVCLVDCSIYFSNYQDLEQVAGYGYYGGVIIPLILSASLIAYLGVRENLKEVISLFGRDMARQGREELAKCIHLICVYSFLYVALFFGLRNTFLPIIGNSLCVACGMPIILALICLLVYVLQNTGRSRIYLYAVIAGFVLHLLLAIILLRNTQLMSIGLVIADYAGLIVCLVLCLMNVMRVYPMGISAFLSVVKPLICAVVSGTVILLLSIIEPANNMLFLLINTVVCTVIYYILLIALQVLSADDLRNLPFGSFVLRRINR